MKFTLSLLLSLLLLACSNTPNTPSSNKEFIAPEAASGYQEKAGVLAPHRMVAAANPLATQAGLSILQAGGSAVDAAIAVQMVLTLVEPQSSGIGGGAFMLHFDGKTTEAFDGRETAPFAATDNLFQKTNGSTMAFYEGVVGGRSVGSPGVMRMLALAHQRHGKLPWAALFQPAITLANNGFAVSPRLALLLSRDKYLAQDAEARRYFYDAQGKPWPAGHLLKNPALANTLQAIATQGVDAFYQGRIAQNIVSKVQHHPSNAGLLSLQDLQQYQAKIRTPVCSDYLQWRVCGMPPPSSGGLAVAQMLGILQRKSIMDFAPVNGQWNTEAIHLFSEAGRLVFADRARYVADPDFTPSASWLPALLNNDYLNTRAALIGPQSMGKATAGFITTGQDNAIEKPSTSHISIVDDRGNGLAMTTSIEDAFGSRIMVDGFLLNNQLTDFSFDAKDADGLIANRVEGGKRPRSAMAPTLVFNKNTQQLVMSIGSPGGSAIINYVTKGLVATLGWQMTMQDAISLPNVGSRNGATELEQGRINTTTQQALQIRGHTLQIIDQTSGLQGIQRITHEGQGVWQGGADPRREGVVLGD